MAGNRRADGHAPEDQQQHDDAFNKATPDKQAG